MDVLLHFGLVTLLHQVTSLATRAAVESKSLAVQLIVALVSKLTADVAVVEFEVFLETSSLRMTAFAALGASDSLVFANVGS